MAHSRGSIRRSQRRRTAWSVGTGGTGLISGASSQSVIAGSGLIPNQDGLTIVRTRGLFDWFLDGPGTADGDGYFGAFGIGIVTDAAFAAGITAIPTPITEQDWDGWFYHTFLSVHQPDVTFGGSPAAHQRIEVDSKAMRKIAVGETVVAVIEVVEIGTATFNAFWDSRQLAKLP